MLNKHFTSEKIVNYLRSAEIEIAKGCTVPAVCKDYKSSKDMEQSGLKVKRDIPIIASV